MAGGTPCINEEEGYDLDVSIIDLASSQSRACRVAVKVLRLALANLADQA